jgi:cyclohexanone monooxygenase
MAQVDSLVKGSLRIDPACGSWYLGANVEGKPRSFLPYAGGVPLYRARCEAAAASCYAGFVVQ